MEHLNTNTIHNTRHFACIVLYGTQPNSDKHTLPRHVQIRYFHLRYKVHVFVHCPIFHQVQSTCIFHFYRISMYKVQVHQFWYEIRFWGTKVHVFSSFLSTKNKFNGKKGTQLKIQKTFDLTKLSMSKSVFRTSKIPCFCLLGKAIHSWKSKSFKKTRTLVPFCTSNVLYCTWVKISGTKYKVQYKYRYKYMYILRWRMIISSQPKIYADQN